MPARRIIPCLDVRDGLVVKGVRFADHRVMGEIEALAERYRDESADELVFYDITASPDGREVDTAWVSRVAAVLDIPFCVAGGIRSIDSARRVLNAGADKISVNSPALERPALINELARTFGSQCVVIGVDSIAVNDNGNTRYQVRSHTGRPQSMRDANRETLAWVEEVAERGAGEIVLNAMDADGVRSGYDITQLLAVRQRCSLPLIASGGAGRAEHFSEVFSKADVDGALAASVFHSGEMAIPDLKSYLSSEGIEVRP